MKIDVPSDRDDRRYGGNYGRDGDCEKKSI